MCVCVTNFHPSVRLKQQAKMAEYCRSIFGDALLIDPLDKYPVRLHTKTHTHKKNFVLKTVLLANYI